MRLIGTQAKGIRLPIINNGDPLAEIITQTLADAAIALADDDIIAVKESIVAKSQGNYATMAQLAADVRTKFPGGTLGIVHPILSRNRFYNILKGIAAGVDKVFVLLDFPADEVGNPIVDIEAIDDINDRLAAVPKPIAAAQFREITGPFVHPFTGMDYVALYESAGAEVYFSDDPRDILKLTPHVLAGDIHTRFRTQKRLQKAGAATAYTLSDLLSAPVDGSGCNETYGVLGSNVSTDTRLKLFPRDCETFLADLRARLAARFGVRPEIMVYGDGAYKDPAHAIWELADPVVSPAHTPRLGGQPSELKMKMLADTQLAGLAGDAQVDAMKRLVRDNKSEKSPTGRNDNNALGTTPRKYADLVGSLCDLISGSGDKGTPVIVVQGYFDNFAAE